MGPPVVVGVGGVVDGVVAGVVVCVVGAVGVVGVVGVVGGVGLVIGGSMSPPVHPWQIATTGSELS